MRQALRALIKTPFVSVVAILSLALGIGANAAIFTAFNQAMLRPLPVHAPSELVNLVSPGPKPGSTACNRAGSCDSVFSYPMFRDLERVQTPFTGIAAHRGFGATLSYDGHTLQSEGMFVSGSYFSVLGLQPALGRLIGTGDEAAWGEAPVVVLSHNYWRLRFNERNVLNETLIVNGHPMTIIGIGPRRFEGTTMAAMPDVFVPITMRGRLEQFDAFENRRSYWVYLFARLKPDVSLAQAQATLNVPYRAILNEMEAPLQAGMSAQILARFRTKELLLEDGRRGQSAAREMVRPASVMSLWVTGTVLLISCVNIANLLLSRAATRTSEMAIRLSLGCSRLRLIGQLLTESYVLATLGAIGGLFVAHWTVVLMREIIPPEAVRLIELGVSREMLAISAFLTLVTGLLFGLAPAVQSTRSNLIATIRGQAGQTGNRAAARFRTGLATTQIALSMALLVAASLFTKSLLNISKVDLGLEVDNVVTFRLAPYMVGYAPERSRALFEQIESAMKARPGVSGVTASRIPLLAGAASGREVQVQGFVAGPDTDRTSRYNVIGTEFFRTLGIGVIAGRDFTVSDALGSPKVAIVNEAFVQKFQLGPDAIGTRMSSDGSDTIDTEIVGIVANTKYAGVRNEMPPQFYLPYRQDDLVGMLTFYVRTSADPASLVGAVPGLVRAIDANVPAAFAKTMPEQVQDNVFLDRGVSVLASMFATLATILAAVGLYGVLAYTVTQRTREIGVRMALGADRGRLRGMVLSQVGWMTLAGGTLGVVAAIGVTRLGRSMLHEMQPYDPGMILFSVIVLSAVSLAAGFLPAHRASRVDPIKALRYE